MWFYQQDDDRQICPTFTIDSADTWEKKTITVDGDTSGVIDNNNGDGLRIGFFLGVGSDFTSGTLASSWEANVKANRVSSSNVNLADSTSNYINITGVQLEVGEGASDFEYLPYDVQLARCQRYYIKITDPAASGVAAGGNSARNSIFLPVTMRATPTVLASGTLIFIMEWSSNWNSSWILSRNFSSSSSIRFYFIKRFYYQSSSNTFY